MLHVCLFFGCIESADCRRKPRADLAQASKLFVAHFAKLEIALLLEIVVAVLAGPCIEREGHLRLSKTSGSLGLESLVVGQQTGS